MTSINITREDIEKILYERAERMMVFTGGKINKGLSHWTDYNLPSGFVIEIDRND
jgi:hypothetical protein